MLLLFKKTLVGVCTVCGHAALGHKDDNIPNPRCSLFYKLCAWALMMLTMCAVCAAVFKCHIRYIKKKKNTNPRDVPLLSWTLLLPCLMRVLMTCILTCHHSRSPGLRITFIIAADYAVSAAWKFQFPSWAYASLIGMISWMPKWKWANVCVILCFPATAQENVCCERLFTVTPNAGNCKEIIYENGDVNCKVFCG